MPAVLRRHYRVYWRGQDDGNQVFQAGRRLAGSADKRRDDPVRGVYDHQCFVSKYAAKVRRGNFEPEVLVCSGVCHRLYGLPLYSFNDCVLNCVYERGLNMAEKEEGMRPGRGCLTCPRETCHGCTDIRQTREESKMLSGIRPIKRTRNSGNCSGRKQI